MWTLQSNEASSFNQTHGVIRRHTRFVPFGLKDFGACEEEFRKATDKFPDIEGAWQMLARVLEIQGKNDEVAKVREKMQQLFQG